MIGAIIGDIVGSIYEFDNIKTKDFTFLTDECFYTDDTVMTLAIASALNICDHDYTNLQTLTIKEMQRLGRNRLMCGFGGRFYDFIISDNPKPYNSYGNGSAMRISCIGEIAKDINECKELTKVVTEISHNHIEGLKGAEAISTSIYLLKNGYTKDELREYINKNYYKLDFTLDEIRKDYSFNETCQGSVPQAIEAFLESTDFMDAIRNAISIGGDSDTIACITGSLAESYYGVTSDLVNIALSYLDDELFDIALEFKEKYLDN